jgi:hypothetical protein
VVVDEPEEELVVEAVYGGEIVGVFYRDSETQGCAVAIFHELFQGVLEQRTWAHQWFPTKKERQELLKSFDVRGHQPLPLTDQVRRSIPWGRLLAEHRAFQVDSSSMADFKPPSKDAVKRALNRKNYLHFRNSRDFSAHAELLRITKAYLVALAARSTTPIADVANELRISHDQAKNGVRRCKEFKYIDKDALGPTSKAIELADEMWRAAEYASKESR